MAFAFCGPTLVARNTVGAVVDSYVRSEGGPSMQSPVDILLPEDHAEIAHGYLAVRCDADVEFVGRAMRILGEEPLAWRDLEARPRGIGSWLVEVAYARVDVADGEPAESGVFRSRPRFYDTE